MTLTSDEFIFVAAEAGSWSTGWPFGIRTADHEAGHATLAVWLGFPIQEIRIDMPDDRSHGHVRLAGDLDRLGDHLLITMAGPIAGDTPIIWPPRAMAPGPDEGTLALLVERLGWGKPDWDRAETVVEEVLHEHRKGLTELSTRLLQNGALPGSVATRIIASMKS